MIFVKVSKTKNIQWKYYIWPFNC